MKIQVTLIASILAVSAFAQSLYVDKSIHDTSMLSELSHIGDGEWDTYLTMDIPHSPVKNLLTRLEFEEGYKMNKREEAHITVITPVEFWNKLKPVGITMKEIEEIAIEENIQKSKFEMKCISKSSAIVKGKKEYTYYIVVESENLLTIRKKVEDLFIKKTINMSADIAIFDYKDYYPHITVGFSNKDLHESNGVIKDTRDCRWSIYN